MSLLRRWSLGFWKHRRKVAPLVLGLGVLVVGGELQRNAPRETDIEYLFGPDHARVVGARIAYMLEGEEVQTARFTFASGAPASIHHIVDLAPGRYTVVVEVLEVGNVRMIERTLEVPAEGAVRIDLVEQAFALAGAFR